MLRLRLDLFFRAEDMRVVLRHLAHAHEAVQRAMRFVAVAAAELRHAHRQVAIGRDALIEDLHMRRAVHRLDRHQVRLARQHRRVILRVRNFVRHHEHVLAVLAPMAGLLPELRRHELRRLHFLVAGRIEPPPDIGFELVVDDETLRVPEHRALRLRLEVEQVHLLPDLAVVALLGLLHHREIGLEVVVVRPARPVDALEHLVPAVAAPVGARKLRQLEGLAELARRGQMRAAAEVEPVALPVNRHRLVAEIEAMISAL